MGIAIITGASSGLGREYALALRKSHPEISEYWLIARRADRLEQVKAELGDVRVRVFPMDLTRKSCLDELRAALDADKPRVQYLVNNSGFGKLGDFATMPEADVTGMVELNCVALTALNSLALGHMGAGSAILLVCSIAAFVPNARMAVYSSTKAYVLSLAKALHYELAPRGVHVLAACPGPMDTEFLAVANIPGRSKTFDQLPRVNPRAMAEKSIAACDKGKCVYTNKLFYKFYRVLAKILPHNLLMPVTKC
ncbi:MAG: SDR family NAD(P)-dependent oxidoreductase [Clostridia bacterium]